MRFEFKVLTASLLLSISAGAAFAAEPIKIGVTGPYTGGSSSMGVSMRDGVRLAAEEINKSGGVLGRQIQLIERDDEAKNERGVQISQELINKEQVVATVGYINTGVGESDSRSAVGTLSIKASGAPRCRASARTRRLVSPVNGVTSAAPSPCLVKNPISASAA